jgi:BolA protein
MSRENRIEALLRDAFAPSHLVVEDQSERHRGHGGWREGGETHVAIDIEAAAFAGLSRLERQRRVNDVLKAEFEGGLHALSVSARAPGE